MSRATPPERSVSSLPPKYRLRHLRRILRTVFAAAVFLCTLSKEPDQIANDPVIAAPRPLTVVLVSTCLSTIAAHMSRLELRGRVTMEAEDLGAQAAIRVGASEIPDDTYQEIVLELDPLTKSNPAIAIQATNDAIRLLFAVGN